MTGGLPSAALAVAMSLQAPEISRSLQMRVGWASNTGGRVDWLAEEDEFLSLAEEWWFANVWGFAAGPGSRRERSRFVPLTQIQGRGTVFRLDGAGSVMALGEGPGGRRDRWTVRHLAGGPLGAAYWDWDWN